MISCSKAHIALPSWTSFGHVSFGGQSRSGGWPDRREDPVAKYIVLINWTDKGVAEAKDTTARAKRAQELAKSLGGTLETLYWTLGRYDIVGIADMPDDESMALFGLKVGGMGSVRSETLRAFTADEIGGILGKM